MGPAATDPPPLTLRAATAADEEFLVAVYASTRMEELAVTGWSADQKDGFCRMQFAAQDKHYREHYPTAQYHVIELAGTPVGRLIVDRWQSEIRIMDISILPAYRGRGSGTRILLDMRDEAASTGKCLSIHVERLNPAQRLYQRLGFRMVEDQGIYLKMEWHAADTAGLR